jgi:hypothetical protein
MNESLIIDRIISRMVSAAGDPGLVSKAKRDVISRLSKAGIKYQSLSAKTIGFGGLGYGDAVFVYIHGAEFPVGWKDKFFKDVPKPSEGGYVVTSGRKCFIITDEGIRHPIVASEDKTAADVDLEVVAGVVRNNSFLSLRHPLERMNIGKVTLDDSGDYMCWMIKTRNGKTIAIVNKKGATHGSGDIVVRDLVIGYL